MSEQKKESFYEKYWWIIWYFVGVAVVSSIVLTPTSIEKTGFILPFFIVVISGVPVGLFLYLMQGFFVMSLGFIFEGIKEKDFSTFFAGIYLLIALLYFAYLS